MLATTHFQPSPVLRRELAWKGIAQWVLADAGVEEVNGLVKVPYRDRNGETLYRKVFGQSGSWYEPGGIDLVPYGIGWLPSSPWIAARSVLLICEGESDSLATRQHYPAMFVLGLPGACAWRSEWAGYLLPFRVILIAGDGDEPGRAMGWLVRKDVPHVRIVNLPAGEDVRSLLQRDGRDGLDPYLAQATLDAHLAWALRKATTLTEFEALLS